MVNRQGGGDSHIKSTGVLIGNFEKTPWYRHDWNFLSQNKTLYRVIFSAYTLKGTIKGPSIDLLRLNNLKGFKTDFFFIPLKCIPRPFFMGAPTVRISPESTVVKGTDLCHVESLNGVVSFMVYGYWIFWLLFYRTCNRNLRKSPFFKNVQI